MIHFYMLLLSIFAVEIFIRLNFFLALNSLVLTSKKAVFIVSEKAISDHWKEKVIPIYALKIIKSSSQMLIAIIAIFSFIYILGNFLDGFHKFLYSIIGITESIIFVTGYIYIRRFF